MPFLRLLTNKGSVDYMAHQSNYCKGLWNFQCQLPESDDFLRTSTAFKPGNKHLGSTSEAFKPSNKHLGSTSEAFKPGNKP